MPAARIFISVSVKKAVERGFNGDKVGDIVKGHVIILCQANDDAERDFSLALFIVGIGGFVHF